MVSATGNNSNPPYASPYGENTSAQLAVSGAASASTKGPGAVEAQVNDTASLDVATKLGEVKVQASDQIDATAAGSGGASASVNDKIKIRVVTKNDQVNVIVKDRTRVTASANGPDASAAVKDNLAVNVSADPGVKVNVIVREKNTVSASASNRPAFLKYADNRQGVTA